jgi:flagellin
MSLVINHNLMAMNAARNLGNVYANLATSTQRLSSGLRVNSAADDAAGLAIRELMRSDITVLNQGIRNASDAISMIQTAEGALSVIDEKLIRMKELAEQAATGTYTTAQREIMNSEYQAMASEIDRIANATDFNGVKLLDGSLQNSHEGSGMKVHFGVGNDAAEDYYFINMSDMRATAQTGLRVGNSDLRDTLRTTKLNATSATSYLNTGQGNSATDGLFGIRYSKDFNAETPSNATWDIYGYVDVDASTDSVSSLVQDINQGRQATGTFTFSSFSSLSVGDSFTVNGFTITFSTAALGGSSFDNTAKTGKIGVGTSLTGATTMSGSRVALVVAKFFNAHAASIGVYGVNEGTMSTGATFTGTTVHLFAHEFGATGNAIGTAESVDGMTVGQTTLAHGGEKLLTASVYFDPTNLDYELQLQMNHGGEKYQVQTFAPTAFSTKSTFKATDSIVGGSISGAKFNWGYSLNSATNGLSSLSAYGQANRSEERRVGKECRRLCRSRWSPYH